MSEGAYGLPHSNFERGNKVHIPQQMEEERRRDACGVWHTFLALEAYFNVTDVCW
jgi:hypothetical protein